MPKLLHVVLSCSLVLIAAPAVRGEPRPAPAIGDVWGRVAVVGDGWVRVPGNLLEKTLERTSSQVSVFRHGQIIPSLVDGEDLVFLALNTARPHTRRAVFSLHEQVPGPALPPSVRVEDDDNGTVGKTIDLRRWGPDRMLGPIAASRRKVYGGMPPVWFAALLHPGGAVDLGLADTRADAIGPQQVSVRVYGTTIGKLAVRARWGEQDLGLAEAESAAGGATLTWRIPDASGEPVLSLEDESPKPPAPLRNDVTRTRGRIWVDRLEMLGEVRVEPGVGTEAFAELDIEHNDGLAIDETPRFAVVVDDNGSPKGSPVRVAKRGRLHTSTFGRLCIGPARRTGRLAAPREDRQSPLKAADDARYVIIATPPLVQPAQRLAKHRKFYGIPSAVVSVLDIYDRYAGGEHTPAAIREFVLDLMAREDVPLDYLVLAGDATFDRTDLAPLVTIPTPMARTKYNGATSADRLYVIPKGSETDRGGPAIGRLPFRTTAQMKAFVDRLTAYETLPRPDLTRNMMRFVTSEGRFGAIVDRMLESAFRRVVTEEIDPAYDIEVTFASTTSPFLWPPPEFNDKVIESLNDGSLFFTYVGHGFAKGFDTLRAGGKYFPILNMEHVDRVAVKGTPPALFVLACTTAMFDGLEDGIGEALLKNGRGPIAFWGATRICHPAANTLLGQAIAHFMSREGETARLGDVLSKARDYAMDPNPKESSSLRNLLGLGINMAILGEETSAMELAREGSYMFTLLGDPATRLALPKGDIGVTAKVDGSNIAVEATGAFPDQTKAVVRVEFPRNKNAIQPKPVDDPLDPKAFPAIRENHRGMNDRVIASTDAIFEGGKLNTTVLTGGGEPGWVVKVIVLTKDQVHVGATILAE